MSTLEEIKASLKDQWLTYYQANQSWIIKLINHYNCYTKTPDGGRRPYSDFILGVVSALEPEIAETLYHFFLVSDNRDRVIEALGLNFDPEKELEKKPKASDNPQNTQIFASTYHISDPIEEIRKQNQEHIKRS